MKSLIITFSCLVFLSIVAQSSAAQDTAALQANYDAKLLNWRTTIKKIRAVGVKYLDANDAIEAKGYRKDWSTLREKGRAEVKELVAAAKELYAVKPTADLTEFIQKIQQKALEDGQPERAYAFGKMLLKNKPNDQDIQLATARAAIKTNRFGEAAAFANKFGTMLADLGQVETEMFDNLQDLQTKYKRELALQAAEAEADDLPRVRLQTNKGDIVVELFENEAPATVANFITLVESGAYSNMTFHRVIKDFMSQTGLKYTDGQYSSIPYTIYDECKEDDARFHFRGSLSMANTGQANSSNIQFFMCHRALSHLDNGHTVFGRVVSGWDAFEDISQTHYIGEKGEENEMENPSIDHIISAEVIRKRDHAYEVQKTVGN